MLTLADELLLLALREQDGSAMIGSTDLACGMAGALLAELALAERVQLVDGRVVAVDPSPLGDPDLDALLARITADGRRRKAEQWVDRARAGIRKRRLARLVAIGILGTREHRVLVFRHTTYPERDPRPEQELRARLRAVLGGAPADERSSALLAIVHACRLDRKAFPDVDRQVLRRRVKEITEEQWAGRAVAKAIAAIQLAVVAATSAAVAATNASTVAGG
ncbi:GOLPH3/VPS74 family protein [Actinoallomurus rhizosphaericola]|uniref:GOLPH3/VPS74 family protein n=1 Tax=Actinoallomurus rhizosphaericola TaxID=2952536 RepID=UPI002092D9B3|nr:GPP34 family phosphoprotein [Actinoallomurus rhizosphaericola]MCO5997772.1 GPP34 family phosphoprotein [Actinoallomurus rhizosphaericola]